MGTRVSGLRRFKRSAVCLELCVPLCLPQNALCPECLSAFLVMKPWPQFDTIWAEAAAWLAAVREGPLRVPSAPLKLLPVRGSC